MKHEQRKPMTRRKARLTALMLLLATFAATLAAVLAALSPVRYDVKQGEISPYTIYAPRAAVDTAATEALVESARTGAQKVYSIDGELISRLVSGAEAFFTALTQVRSNALAMLPEGQTAEGMDAAAWSAALDADKKATLCEMTAPALDETALTGVLSSTAQDTVNLKDIVLSKLRTSLEAGLSEEGVAGVRSSCVREINAMTGISSALKQTAALVFDEFMQPTLTLDEAATAAAQDEAAALVEPVTVKKGELIAERGAPVTASQYAILSQLGLVRTDEANVSLNVGVTVLLLADFFLFAAYMFMLRRDVLHSVKKMVIIAILTSLTMGLAFLSNKVNFGISPALIAIMLTALLADERTALALTALLSVPLGMMAGGAEELLSQNAFIMCVSTLASGFAAVPALRKTQSRGALIAAGSVGGAAASVTVIAAALMRDAVFIEILEAVAWSFGSAMISTLFVAGSLSVWEGAFDVATPARLSELSNTNNPLLRQLMTEAPGTYQHSVMAAALAEAAAERVGADPLLARVACYYHDVGKLRRPLYFKENQKNGENIHDKLPPAESAATIIAHQKDGITLLTKYKLPSAVIKICGEHHGNSLMAYFFHKAKQADEGVSQKGFRYPGNRPSTKESAIVMLADSCEAAVRSLGETNSVAVEQMVHKIIWGKMSPEDNLMASAPLTMAEFTEIEKSFIKTFSGIMHDRIEYPDMDENKK